MRHDDLVRDTLDSIKEDVAWRMSMPGKYRRLVAPLIWRLRGRYGYE